mmetsp:Transcript_122638/g.183444  ORF Transcript_122638/g.183444 Transcript_122638/m.183444 type:complete len:286 (+) Transcript_122638:668-1525(+)
MLSRVSLFLSERFLTCSRSVLITSISFWKSFFSLASSFASFLASSLSDWSVPTSSDFLPSSSARSCLIFSNKFKREAIIFSLGLHAFEFSANCVTRLVRCASKSAVADSKVFTVLSASAVSVTSRSEVPRPSTSMSSSSSRLRITSASSASESGPRSISDFIAGGTLESTTAATSGSATTSPVAESPVSSSDTGLMSTTASEEGTSSKASVSTSGAAETSSCSPAGAATSVVLSATMAAGGLARSWSARASLTCSGASTSTASLEVSPKEGSAFSSPRTASSARS